MVEYKNFGVMFSSPAEGTQSADRREPTWLRGMSLKTI